MIKGVNCVINYGQIWMHVKNKKNSQAKTIYSLLFIRLWYHIYHKPKKKYKNNIVFLHDDVTTNLEIN